MGKCVERGGPVASAGKVPELLRTNFVLQASRGDDVFCPQAHPLEDRKEFFSVAQRRPSGPCQQPAFGRGTLREVADGLRGSGLAELIT